MKVLYVEGSGVPGIFGALVRYAGIVARELPGMDPGGKLGKA